MRWPASSFSASGTCQDRRHTAQHDLCGAADLIIHLEDDSGADDGVCPRLAIHHLVIGAPRIRTRCAQLDGGQHFIVGQHVLSRRVAAWRCEKVSRRHPAVAAGPDDSRLGVERDERGSRVGRMHDVARPAAEDRMELVLAGKRKALVAPGLVAGNPLRKYAPRPLADVAGQASRRCGSGAATVSAASARTA